jgi:hypothetical protein
MLLLNSNSCSHHAIPNNVTQLEQRMTDGSPQRYERFHTIKRLFLVAEEELAGISPLVAVTLVVTG